MSPKNKIEITTKVPIILLSRHTGLSSLDGKTNIYWITEKKYSKIENILIQFSKKQNLYNKSEQSKSRKVQTTEKAYETIHQSVKSQYLHMHNRSPQAILSIKLYIELPINPLQQVIRTII